METKTCSKCHTEKNLNEFHRRGAGQQNICKTCRLAHKTVTPRPTRKPNISAGVGERVVALESKLRLIARQNTGNADQAEDCYSHVCEYLLTHMQADDPTERYLATAKLAAKSFVAKQRTYTWYVGAEEEIPGTFEDGKIEYLIPDDGMSTEDEVIQREQLEAISEFLDTLTPENKQILRLLYVGERQVDISVQMGVSRSAVSQRVEALSQKLELHLAIS